MNNVRNCCTAYPSAQTAGCCKLKDEFPQSVAYAMAYVPFQQWCETYCIEKALCQGTVFPVLDKPFMGGRCK